MSDSTGAPSAMSRRTVLRGSATLVGMLSVSAVVGCSDDPGGSDASTGTLADAAMEPTSFWAVIADRAIEQDPSLEASTAAAELGITLEELDEGRSLTDARRTQLGDAVTADFAAGRTIAVDGWVLARTEVLLAVATAGAGR